MAVLSVCPSVTRIFSLHAVCAVANMSLDAKQLSA